MSYVSEQDSTPFKLGISTSSPGAEAIYTHCRLLVALGLVTPWLQSANTQFLLHKKRYTVTLNT